MSSILPSGGKWQVREVLRTSRRMHVEQLCCQNHSRMTSNCFGTLSCAKSSAPIVLIYAFCMNALPVVSIRKGGGVLYMQTLTS